MPEYMESTSLPPRSLYDGVLYRELELEPAPREDPGLGVTLLGVTLALLVVETETVIKSVK